MDEFLNKEYSPSQWTVRMAPDEVVLAHGDVLKSNSDRAYESDLLRFSLDLTVKSKVTESKEHRLEIFYKNKQSFEYKNEKMNFNGHKVFVYLHGGYWVNLEE